MPCADNGAISGASRHERHIIPIPRPLSRCLRSGLLLAVGIALVAWWLGRYVPLIGGPVIGIVLGIARAQPALARRTLSAGHRSSPASTCCSGRSSRWVSA
jgi:hypothetical protein